MEPYREGANMSLDSIRILLSTSRPISWVNTAYPFIVGYLLLGGEVDAMLIIGGLFFLIPYNLLMYGINDIYDYESDILNPRKGGVEGAITPKSLHPLIMKSSILLSTPFILWLLLQGSFVSNITLTIVIFFVVAYSLKGLRFKEIPVLDSITSSAHFVGPLVYALSLFGFPPEAWPFVVAFFLWGIASQSFGAVQDILPDREGKISSIATVFGARNTVWFAFANYLVCILIILTQTTVTPLISIVLMTYLINIAPFLAVTDKTSGLTRAGWKRFLWINYAVGAVVTMSIFATQI
jgi:4-hydroxybenzoate polyprenyltransferase